MKFIRLIIFILIIASFSSAKAFAAARYWVGSTDGANTSSTANWSTSANSCGSGGGSSVPGASDTAFFVSNCLNGATIDVGTSLGGVNLAVGYSGTITQASGNSLAIGNTGWTQANGTFTGGNSAITFNNGSLSLTGGTFTNSSAGLTIDRSLTWSGGTLSNSGKTITFNDNEYFYDSSTITCSGTIDGTVVITRGYGASVFTIGTGCIISLGASPTTSAYNSTFINRGTINIPSGTWTVNADLVTIDNYGTINHSGTGWDLNGGLINESGGIINYSGTTLSIAYSYTAVGTFDLTGKTLTFDNSNRSGSAVTCTGDIGATAVIFNKYLANASISSGCNVTLGAGATTTMLGGTLTNNGTITIPSGKWTLNTTSAPWAGALVNNGTITHNGDGWDFTDTSLTNSVGATITYTGSSINFQRNFTQSGVFDLTGKTITATSNDSTYDSGTVTCSGDLGGTFVFNKGNAATGITIAAGCNVDLGANPTSSLTQSQIINNGTITVDSGTWTLTATVGGVTTNNGTINHNGNGWDINGSLINGSSGIINYGGTTMSISGSFTANGTFTNLPNQTITFDDYSNTSDTTLTCTGTFPAAAVYITKAGALSTSFTLASGCTLNLPASPTTVVSRGTFVNNGIIVIPSGTWTVSSGYSHLPLTFTNNGTITHNGSNWIINNASFTNGSSGIVNYAGTTLSIEQNFTYGGTFDLTGKTVTLNDGSNGGTSGTDDTTMVCNAPINGNVAINKVTSTDTFVLGSGCTIAGDFTRTDGVVSNPGSAYTLTLQGNYSQSATDTVGGANMTLSLGGTGTQTFTINSGTTFSSILNINKTGGQVNLASAVTTGQTCTVAAGTFNLNGQAFVCGSTFTIQNGGSLQMIGSESPTTPTLNSGSTVIYAGTASNYTIKSWNYQNLTFNGIGGTFTAPAGTLNVAGNWTNTAGVFVHNNGTVDLGTGDQTVSGNTTFYNLTKSVTNPQTLTFSAGSTQVVTNTMTLNGATGNLLSLRSSSAGTQWLINPQSTRTISYLDVKDSNNINASVILTPGLNITNSGNNLGWLFRSFILAGKKNSSSAIDTSFGGKLDDTRVYNKALPPSEIAQLAAFAPPPVAYWNFEEGVGNTVNDVSGNNNIGSWGGTGTHWVNGKYGNAGNFNGTDDYVSIGSTIPNVYTVSFWIKPTTTNQQIVGFDGGTHYIYANGGISAAGFSSPSIYVNGTLTSTIVANTWQYVTITTATSFSGNLITLGKTSSDYLNGTIDDFKIYTYVRNQKQITEDMNAGHPAGGSPVGSQIGYWKFDEGQGSVANNTGSIGSSLNGTITGATWSQNGKYGKALSFTNARYITLPTTSSLNPSEITISAWVNPNSTPYNGGPTWNYCSLGAQNLGMIASRNGTYFDYVFGLNSSRQLFFCEGVSGTRQALSVSTLTANTFSHVVVTFDASKNVNLYINGKLESTTTFSNAMPTESTGTFLGAYYSGAGYLSGLLDEVKIYNSALTADEVKIDYNRGATLQQGSTNQTIGATTTSLDYCAPGDTTICSPPIAEWNFNEGGGTTAYDTSGSGNNGSWNGTLGSQWIIGKDGKAGNLNGTDNYLQVADVAALGVTQVSVEMWLNWDGASSYPTTRHYAFDGRGHTYMIFIDEPDEVNFAIKIGSNYYGDGTVTSTITPGTWTHFSATFDGTTMRLYKNGIEIDNLNVSGSIATAAGNTQIGEYIGGGNYYYDGKVDQVKVFNYARTPAQIAYDYNRGGPVGWWKLDECQGSIAYDSSGIGTTGLITIGASGTQNSLGTCTVGTSATWTNGTSGKYNSSLSFDGTDDYVSIPDNNTLDLTTNASVSYWFKRPATGTQINFMKWQPNQQSYGLQIFTDNKIYWNISGAGNNNTYFTSTNTFTETTNWHHLTATYNGTAGSMKAYLDGTELAGSISGAVPTSIFNSTAPLENRYNSTNYNKGQLDDIRIYNYDLTSTQVKTLYNNNSGLQFSQ